MHYLTKQQAYCGSKKYGSKPETTQNLHASARPNEQDFVRRQSLKQDLWYDFKCGLEGRRDHSCKRIGLVLRSFGETIL